MKEPEYIRRISEEFNRAYPFDFGKHCIGLGYMGARSHGTYVPPSDPQTIDDIDMMGIVIPPLDYTIGFEVFDNWTLRKDELDVVVYSLKKFIGLLLSGNPNVLGLLWLREQDYLLKNPAFQHLIDYRDIFSSKQAHESFAGYANGQLRRMESFTPEIQAEIDKLEYTFQYCGWNVKDVMEGKHLDMPTGVSPETVKPLIERYRNLSKKFHTGYMGQKRKQLVLKYGYDTKNAAHLIRLLQMCIEFMDTGKVNVFREDAELIKQIKRGEWALDDVKKYAEELFEKARSAKNNSVLPDFPNRVAANKILIGLSLAQ